MKQITCNFCGDTYPDFDAAHVCSKGPYAPRLKPKMNERIRQLAEQAGFYYTDKTGFITPAGCDPKKFAELIVLDTIKDCRDMFIVDSVSWNLLNGKLEHFGVEV